MGEGVTQSKYNIQLFMNATFTNLQLAIDATQLIDDALHSLLEIELQN